MRDMRDEALNILIREQGGKFKLDENALDRVLGDREELAVVISVAGPFRKGKSFLLDYFLRYLDSGRNDLGEESKPLQGFSWRGGSERDTTGLLAWSKVFPVKLIDGRSAGILLLDTQGAFDCQSTVRESAVVFALSTLLCSIQVYNLSQNIQEDDLQHLQLFAEYGRVAARYSCSTPFQKLVFLVRDWSYPYEADYGFYGGEKIVDRRLKISEEQHPELKDIRKHIATCFSDIYGFLMPHPGQKVASDPRFDGRLADLEPVFKLNLESLIDKVFSPEFLVVKKIDNQELKIKDLRHYFKKYMEIFSGDTIPEPRTILSATAEANHLAAVATSRDLYSKKMNNICGATKSYMDPNQLELEHRSIKNRVLQDFKNKPKMGSKTLSESYLAELDQTIEQMFLNFKQLNEAKNAYMTFLTPGLFLGCAVFFYMVSGLLGIIGLYTMSNWCNILVGVYLVGAGTWAYIRWTGELQHIGRWIDTLACFLWYQVIIPAYQAAAAEPNS